MARIPVYLFTGFLEGGKTHIIQESMEDKRFNSGEKTLILQCEEGVDELDLSAFASGNCYLELIEDPDDLTAANLTALGKKYKAQYFSSSALRFSNVAKSARIGEYGKIRGAALISPSPIEEQGTHNYYTWYGIHGFEPLVAIMGIGVDKVSCFRNDTEDVINGVW